MQRPTISRLLLLATLPFVMYSCGDDAQAAGCDQRAMSAMTAKWQEKMPILQGATSPYIPLVTSSGCKREFQGGTIYFNNSIAREIHGAIRGKFLALGGEAGLMGYPTTDESTTPDTFGRYNHFEKGSIYWRPCVGAFEVHGLIRNVWANQGWEKGPLGYPLSDERKGPDGAGRITDFQGGSVAYHPNLGTFTIPGELRRVWRDRGGLEAEGPGYPTAAPLCFFNTCTQSFQRGQVNMNDATNVRGRDLRKEIARRGITIRDQGANRPTCSVMTMTFLLDYQYSGMCGNHMALLSEEYLNHMGNVASGRDDDGDFFEYIAMGYDKYGMIPDSRLPYDPSRVYNFASMSGLINQTMINDGKTLLSNGLKMKGHFLKPNDGTVGLSDAQFNEIFGYINRGIPVGIGRGHSMPIVGFQRDDSWAGGGYFIFRNSYGTDEGESGYQKESFADVKATVNDAYVYERVNN